MTEGTRSNRVKQARLAEAKSRSELARAAHLTDKTVMRVEEGTAHVRDDTKHKIVKGFNSLTDRAKTYTFEDLFPNG